VQRVGIMAFLGWREMLEMSELSPSLAPFRPFNPQIIGLSMEAESDYHVTLDISSTRTTVRTEEVGDKKAHSKGLLTI
jgi:hypothetical protein